MLTPEITFEGESAFEGDFVSEDESESEGDSESEEVSTDESESENESNYEPDSDDVPYSRGHSTFNSGHASEGGPSKDGPTSEGNPSSDIVPISKEDSEQVHRPQRIRQIPRRFAEFDMLQDTEVGFEGEVIQCAMLVDYEPVSTEETLKKKVWSKTMKEELEAIERNKT